MRVRGNAGRRGSANGRILTGIAILLVLVAATLLLTRRGNAPPVDSGKPAPQVASTEKPSGHSPAIVALPEAPSASPAPLVKESPNAGESASEILVEWKGRVVAEPGGVPIAGARVEVLGIDEKGKSRRSWVVLQQREKPPVLASAMTDANGEWSLRAPGTDSAGPGTCLYASAEGHANRIAYVMPSEERKAGDPLLIKLPAGGSVSGHVVNDAGVGIDGATVGGSNLDNAGSGGMEDGVYYRYASWGTSSPDGTFRLAGLPVAIKMIIPAHKKGFVPGISEDLQAGTSDARIVLTAGGATIRGRVLEADGRPALNAVVIASPVRQGNSDYRRTIFQATSATVEDDGTFSIENLAKGKWQVSATRMNAATMFSFGASEEAQQQVQLEANATVELELRFQKPITIIGRALDTETKAGIPGVRVSTSPYEQFVSSGGTKKSPLIPGRVEAISDGAGAFRITAPFREPAPLYIDVPEGWVLEAEPTGMPGMVYVRGATEGEEHTMDLRLTRGVSLRGKVTFADGAGAAEIPVTAQERPTWRRSSTTTRADGTFELAVLRDRTVTLTALAPSAAGEATCEIPAKGAPPEVTIVLDAFASFAGSVKDARGIPVPGVAIQTMRVTDGGRSRSSVGTDVITDAQGNYTKDKVMAGIISVSARPPAKGDFAMPEPISQDLAPGEKKTGVDFVLSPGEYIDGVVMNEEKEPIPGATVNWWLSRSSGMVMNANTSTSTDDKGYYRIGGLSEKEVIQNLSVTHPEYEGGNRSNVSLMDGEQNFILKKKGDITLVAVDESTNEPITRYDYLLSAHAWTQATSWGQSPIRVEAADGRTPLKLSSTNGQRVVVAEIGKDGKPTGRKGAARFTPDGGKTREVIVRVGGGKAITGTVVMDTTNEPVEGAAVTVFVQQMGPSFPSRAANPTFDFPNVTSDKQGRFTLAGLTIGSYTLTAAKDELNPVTMPEVELEADVDPEPVTIRMGTSGAIFGRVIGPDGKPVAGGRLQYYLQTAWSDQSVTSDEQGAYRIPKLTAGRYYVTLTSDQKSIYESRNVDLAAGEEKEVNFDLSDTLVLTGTILLDGAPWQGGMPNFSLQSDTNPTGVFRAKGAGRYECRVRAGSWRLTMQETTGINGTAERFEIDATPREQTRDFEVRTTSADVALDPVEGVEFAPGSIRLEQRIGETTVGTSFVQGDQERRHIPRVLAGEYRAKFQSNNRALEGESEWTTIAPGSENVVYVPVKKSELSQLAQAQQMLKELGYDPGPVDGIMGPMTGGALRRFQQDQSLPVTGQPDAPTMTKLKELKGK